MFLGLGLFGLVLLSLHLLMLIGLVVVLFPAGAWFWVGEVLLLGLLRLVDVGCPGGPSPCQGLVLGRGMARFRLGGHKVRKVPSNAVDVHDAADVFMYRDSSIAPHLDMRRRFKAVMELPDAMICCGVSLSRSIELSAQWDRILAIGP